MIGAWALFPLLLAVLAVGCGLLLETLARVRVPGALVIPVGLAVAIVAGHVTTATDATAELTVPLLVALAVAGFALSPRPYLRRPDPWLVGAAVIVFIAFGAPILVSGDPTFAGYIRLDDTATWLALTDRVMEHGHSLDGLAPSTYEATLAFNLGEGYPVGVFIPLGAGSVLTGIDPAWLIQPYMSLLAAVLALCVWEIAAPLVPSRPLRAAVVAIAAQPALLVGYAHWGGVKEVAAAALVALCVAVALRLVRDPGPRGWIGMLAVAIAALLAVLSLGGIAWVGPALAVAAGLVAARHGWRLAVRRAAGVAVLAGLLSMPLIVPALLEGRLLPPTSSPLTSETARGNLIEPLGLERLFGVWPAGDFRLDAVDGEVTAVLVVVAAAAALAGIAYAGRRGSLGPVVYGLGITGACVVLVGIGSPWVDGKAMATASPAVLTLAAAGAAAAIGSGRRVEGWLALGAIAVGVGWSNVLAYRDVNLAPYQQLAELGRIGEMIAGEGPTLMTEYQPFGARHFLREADPEAVSELRRRVTPRRGGGTVEKGHWSDTDQLALDGVLAYRTMVLRRSPVQSRPPAPYRLVHSGDFYDVWQRPAVSPLTVAAHMPLGGTLDPAGRTRCERLQRLASRVGEGGALVYEREPPLVAMAASSLDHPRSWSVGNSGVLMPEGDGTAATTVSVPRSGTWTVWLRGSIRGRMQARLDGTPVGSVRHLLNNAGLYVELGSIGLEAGEHRLELEYEGPDLLHPGSGGAAPAVGPLVLSLESSDDRRVSRTSSGAIDGICAQRLDWIEALL